MSEISITNTQECISILKAYCQQFHLDCSDDCLRLCLQHLSLVIEANQSINLTRITNVQDALVLHILDSLLFASYVNDAPEGPLLDFGTGAGFPGLPLAIATNRQTVLLDSVGKKIQCVQRFINALDLDNVSAQHARVEDFAVTHRNAFSCIVARAVAELPILVEYASPLLTKQGLFIVSKGNPSTEEIDRGCAAAQICGLKQIASYAIDLPNDLGHRTFIIYQKVSRSSVRLPRKAGTAKKSPLA